MMGMGRELGISVDQRQAGTGRSLKLKPGAFGAMTAILAVPLQRRRKPSGHNGLMGDCRHRYWQDGKSGRNSALEILLLFGVMPDIGLRARLLFFRKLGWYPDAAPWMK